MTDTHHVVLNLSKSEAVSLYALIDTTIDTSPHDDEVKEDWRSVRDKLEGQV